MKFLNTFQHRGVFDDQKFSCSSVGNTFLLHSQSRMWCTIGRGYGGLLWSACIHLLHTFIKLLDYCCTAKVNNIKGVDCTVVITMIIQISSIPV